MPDVVVPGARGGARRLCGGYVALPIRNTGAGGWIRNVTARGVPTVRPLWWEFPDAGHDVDDQYLLGPDLLVAPVATQGATSRSIVFPGPPTVEWESLWDPQTVVKGGQTKTIDAPLATIPVYKRKGGAKSLDGVVF